MRRNTAHNRDLTSEASALLSKFRGLQSVMFALDCSDPEHVKLIDTTAEAMSQAVSSSSPRIYTDEVDNAQDTWDAAEIQSLVAVMNIAGREKLTALKELLEDAFQFLSPVGRARHEDSHSLAESDIATDLIYESFHPGECTRRWSVSGSLIRLELCVRRLLSLRRGLGGWVRGGEDVEEEPVGEAQARSNDLQKPRQRPKQKQKQRKDREHDEITEPREEAMPDAGVNLDGDAAMNDEEIARIEQEKEYNMDPTLSPAEIAAKVKEAKANAEVEKRFAETERQFDLGLLQISDEAVPAGGAHKDPDVMDEDDGADAGDGDEF